MEFADDQQLLAAMERVPGLPRERQLEEKLLARWMTDRLHKCVKGYKEVAGFEVELTKGFSMWTTPPPRIPRVTNAELDG
jgi:hypothetical protein